MIHEFHLKELFLHDKYRSFPYCSFYRFCNKNQNFIVIMDFDKERSFEVRAVIIFNLREWKCYQHSSWLLNVYGDSAHGYSTVARWAADFKRGKNSLQEEPRSGRPVEATTTKNINEIREMVEENPLVKAHEIAVISWLSNTIDLNILHKKLHL